MGQIKNIKLHIVTDIKAIIKMLRVAQKSKLLGASARLLASTSRTTERDLSQAADQKAVIFNLAGGVVPSMYPVFEEYAKKFTVPPKPDEIKQKVLMEADDPQLLENIKLMLGSRNGSIEENLADVLDAVKSIQAEGWKAILVHDTGDFKNIPVDTSAFDQVISELSETTLASLNTGAEKSDIVYVDSAADKLAAAADLGLSTVEVNDSYLETLTSLEGKLGVPLKTCIPGVTFNWYDAANNPHKKNGWYGVVSLLALTLLVRVMVVTHFD